MAKQFFVTGTDTEVGKTQTCAGLLTAATEQGWQCLGLKPVASGAELIDGVMRNEDALALQDSMSMVLDYDEINPYRFVPAIAPHIAARQAGVDLNAEAITATCQKTLNRPCDFALIEGAGGWRVPLNDSEFFSDIPRRLNLPVVIVVGMRLGCINHALLTAQAIINDGLSCAGWVANRVTDEMSHYQDNLLYLKNNMPCELLGEVPFLASKSAFLESKNIYNKMLVKLLSWNSDLD